MTEVESLRGGASRRPGGARGLDRRNDQHRLIVALEGGLGNQLFQFANAYSLSADHDLRLVLETRIGFWLDRQYRRSFLLDRMTKEFDIANWSETSLVLAGRMRRRLLPSKTSLHTYIGRTHYITETEEAFIPNLWAPGKGSTSVIQGYWQAPRYFDHHTQALGKLLYPPTPASSSIRELGAQMARCRSTAVGIRLYEESQDPKFHARDRVVKTPHDYSRALAQLSDIYPSDHMYVFSTHHFDFIDQIVWPKPTTIISHESGVTDPLDRLWLMTQADSYVFNNSTFYWWGAWLRSAHSASPPIVIASDNFRNADAYKSDWLLF